MTRDEAVDRVWRATQGAVFVNNGWLVDALAALGLIDVEEREPVERDPYDPRPADSGHNKERPMTVRAKFVVCEINQFQANKETDDNKTVACVAHKVRMAAVYESPPADSKDRGNAARENRIFGRATPSAQLEMTILNEAAAAHFKVGKSYYIDFTPAD